MPPSARVIASAIIWCTSAMSGAAVTIAGGTSETVEIFWSFAFSARPMKRSSSLAGRFVDTISDDAAAMSWKFESAVWGEIWRSIALITHFWRAIRE